jgi:hypothetical protein
MWTKASKEEAQAARDAGRLVRFTPEGWMIEDHRFGEHGWSMPEDKDITSDLTKEAAEVFRDMGEYVKEMKELEGRVGGGPLPMQRNLDGTYDTPWRECECGEQYLVHMEHEGTSIRHKEWATGGIEVPVPTQPLPDQYPRDVPTPRLEMGVSKICPRCKAMNKNGETYYPDPDSRVTRRYPCRRCNGHGVVPNVGP